VDNNIAGSRQHHTSTLGLSSNIKESMTVLSGCLQYRRFLATFLSA
jgi:hypothetical protein